MQIMEASPILLMKAVKNPTELAGLKQSCVSIQTGYPRYVLYRGYEKQRQIKPHWPSGTPHNRLEVLTVTESAWLLGPVHQRKNLAFGIER